MPDHYVIGYIAILLFIPFLVFILYRSGKRTMAAMTEQERQKEDEEIKRDFILW